MKQLILSLFVLILPFTLLANEPSPPLETASTPSTKVVTPTWAIEPIGPPTPNRKPSSKTMQYKRAAVAFIGTAAMITIGLLVTGNNTGKRALPSSHQ